jgi:hypothetical protein
MSSILRVNAIFIAFICHVSTIVIVPFSLGEGCSVLGAGVSSLIISSLLLSTGLHREPILLPTTFACREVLDIWVVWCYPIARRFGADASFWHSVEALYGSKRET